MLREFSGKEESREGRALPTVTQQAQECEAWHGENSIFVLLFSGGLNLGEGPEIRASVELKPNWDLEGKADSGTGESGK